MTVLLVLLLFEVIRRIAPIIFWLRFVGLLSLLNMLTIAGLLFSFSPLPCALKAAGGDYGCSKKGGGLVNVSSCVVSRLTFL